MPNINIWVVCVSVSVQLVRTAHNKLLQRETPADFNRAHAQSRARRVH